MIAACVLHNYCIDKNDVYDFPEYNDINNINIYNDELNIPNCEVQGDRRMQLFNEIFSVQ